METREMSKKGLYVGTGIGLILFALVGLFVGSFLGGVIGLKISTAIMGSPVHASLLPRIVVAAGMMVGVVISAVTFIFGMGLLGWSAGYVIDALKGKQMLEATSGAYAENGK